ncbi:MAG: pyruvate, phosphate dikinase [Spirochaetaceae bacterium]|nr:MAG: pyruvate, phosphate dikinase [Spirochaetaceae bacterium]
MQEYYSFSSTEYLTDPEALEAVGSRGRRVMELASLGAPISPGFLMLNETLNRIAADEKGVFDMLQDPIADMEQTYGKQFDDPDNPLLIKVVESPMLNMVNTFSTIHNIGLSEQTVEGFAAYVGQQFAYHEFGNVFANIAEMELLSEGVPAARKKALEKAKSAFEDAARQKDSKKAVVTAIEKNRSVFPAEVFTDCYEQLRYVLKLYHQLFQINQSSSDSAILVQTMVFGNFGKESLFGTFSTRDIITGESGISGEFFEGAFDETAIKGKPIAKIAPKYKSALDKIGSELEKHFREIRRVRFTVEQGKLWVIDQNDVVNKSAQAELKTLLDLHKKKVIDDRYIIETVKPGRLSEILHPALDLGSVKGFGTAEGGIAGSVGAAIGRVFFDTDELIKAYRMAVQKDEDANFILAMPSTFAEDVKAIEVATGVLASEGGYASHAPVVARSLGKVALVYPGIEWGDHQMKIGKKVVKQGDYITLNVPYYEDPTIYFGSGQLTKPSPEGSGLLEFLAICEKHITPDFDVHCNGDQPKDALLARKFNAHGIGLCRTEHMFFAADRILKFRTMIITANREDREKALAELKKFQVKDFYELLKIMDGLPVTIRLLDAPLHEFLPHTRESMDEFIKYFRQIYPKVTEAEVRARCDLLKEFNPMLGHRGIRVAISYPEIYNMQVEALFEAAYKLKSEKMNPKPEIMIPLIMSATEMKTIRNGKRIEGKAIVGIKEIEERVKKKFKGGSLDYKVGTMIELPAAALNADQIARYAEFFSFGTNDLTQTTCGLSRDDFNGFFSDYNEFDLLEANPFKILGPQVKELIKIAAERGRLTRPDISMGLCGEHGAEPENIVYVREAGLNYTSCSPYGIPIAKHAVAKMNVAAEAAAGAAASA